MFQYSFSRGLARTLGAAAVIACLAAGSAQADNVADTRALAEQGNAKAQYNLGVMYANGRGVPQDDAKAAKWNKNRVFTELFPDRTGKWLHKTLIFAKDDNHAAEIVHAFREVFGDPTDEPAGALLARITAEKGAAKKPRRKTPA